MGHESHALTVGSTVLRCSPWAALDAATLPLREVVAEVGVGVGVGVVRLGEADLRVFSALARLENLGGTLIRLRDFFESECGREGDARRDTCLTPLYAQSQMASLVWVVMLGMRTRLAGCGAMVMMSMFPFGQANSPGSGDSQ